MTKVVFLAADTQRELNTSVYRCKVPAERLSNAGYFCFLASIHEIISSNISLATKQAVDESDVIVIERLAVAETHDFISSQRDRGKRVWVTFDDNYALIPPSVTHDIWRGGKSVREGKGSILNEFRNGLRLVDGYITPSKILCDDFKLYNPNNYVVPNYLDMSIWDNLPDRNPDSLVVGYGGSSLHNISLKESGVIPAIGKLCQKYPRLQFHLQTPYPDVVEMLRKSNVRFTTGNWLPFQEWPKVVSSFSIGIAPLSGEYDKRRSSLRTQELGMGRVPWVATDDCPYACSVGGIRTINKSQAWHNALEEILDDIKTTNHYAEEGYVWATEFNKNCEKRYTEVLGL